MRRNVYYASMLVASIAHTSPHDTYKKIDLIFRGIGDMSSMMQGGGEARLRMHVRKCQGMEEVT